MNVYPIWDDITRSEIENNGSSFLSNILGCLYYNRGDKLIQPPDSFKGDRILRRTDRITSTVTKSMFKNKKKQVPVGFFKHSIFIWTHFRHNGSNYKLS